jgi:hypothetical protein
LLQEYPDLQALPAADRGWVFYEKIRADIIVGIPLGLGLGVLYVLTAVLIGTAQVMIAGPLLRQGRARHAVLGRYLEAAFPATALLCEGFRIPVEINYFSIQIWHLSLFGLLLAAVTGTLRGWPWPLRLLVHAGWLFSALMVARQYL